MSNFQGGMLQLSRFSLKLPRYTGLKAINYSVFLGDLPAKTTSIPIIPCDRFKTIEFGTLDYKIACLYNEKLSFDDFPSLLVDYVLSTPDPKFALQKTMQSQVSLGPLMTLIFSPELARYHSVETLKIFFNAAMNIFLTQNQANSVIGYFIDDLMIRPSVAMLNAVVGYYTKIRIHDYPLRHFAKFNIYPNNETIISIIEAAQIKNPEFILKLLALMTRDFNLKTFSEECFKVALRHCDNGLILFPVFVERSKNRVPNEAFKFFMKASEGNLFTTTVDVVKKYGSHLANPDTMGTFVYFSLVRNPLEDPIALLHMYFMQFTVRPNLGTLANVFRFYSERNEIPRLCEFAIIAKQKYKMVYDKSIVNILIYCICGAGAPSKSGKTFFLLNEFTSRNCLQAIASGWTREFLECIPDYPCNPGEISMIISVFLNIMSMEDIRCLSRNVNCVHFRQFLSQAKRLMTQENATKFLYAMICFNMSDSIIKELGYSVKYQFPYAIGELKKIVTDRKYRNLLEIIDNN